MMEISDLYRIGENFIECTPDLLDDARKELNTGESNYSHFTIGKGKAKYHYFHVPDGTIGIYYAFRVGEDGYLEARRAVYPDKVIRVFPEN